MYSAEDTISGHEGLTRIQVIEPRSALDIPSIAITFANGVKDALVLERFYPTEQSRMEKKVSCNFIGRLENEKTACVAVTGCPGEEMAFTIKSKHSENIGYILYQDGQLESVESTFKVILSRNYNLSIQIPLKLKFLWKENLALPIFLKKKTILFNQKLLHCQ